MKGMLLWMGESLGVLSMDREVCVYIPLNETRYLCSVYVIVPTSARLLAEVRGRVVLHGGGMFQIW